ncbi:hypothetical protein [Caldithrix abyssi]
MINFGLKIICLFFFCDYLRNLRENYFAHVALDFGCGTAALEFESVIHAQAEIFVNKGNITPTLAGARPERRTAGKEINIAH